MAVLVLAASFFSAKHDKPSDESDCPRGAFTTSNVPECVREDCEAFWSQVLVATYDYREEDHDGFIAACRSDGGR